MEKEEGKQSWFQWLLYLLLAAFLCFALMRATFIRYKYHDFREAIGGTAARSSNQKKVGEILYGVTEPEFPHWSGGRLYIQEQGVIYTDGNTFDKVDLDIFPQIYDGYVIKAEVQCVSYDEVQNVPHIERFVFQLDEAGKLLSVLNEAEQRVFEEHEELIQERYQQAYEMWGILGQEHKE